MALKNSIIKLLYANVVFYHIESFSANKIFNNVKKMKYIEFDISKSSNDVISASRIFSSN